MAYVPDLLKGSQQPTQGRISLERFVLESSYITKYLSKVVKDKALAVYSVLFYLSWFETGRGQIVVAWSRVGSFIRSEQGNIIESGTTVRRRLPDLLRTRCITTYRQRGGANAISVHLPSEIPACRLLLDQDLAASAAIPQGDDRDYYNDPDRRRQILDRDSSRCAYCLIELTQDTFVVDHLVSVAQGGSNRKSNLVASCQACNQRKGDGDAAGLLQANYRSGLITQQEYLQQRSHLDALLAEPQETG